MFLHTDPHWYIHSYDVWETTNQHWSIQYCPAVEHHGMDVSWHDIIREDRCSVLQSGGRQIPSVFPSFGVLQQISSLHAASKNTALSSSPWPLFLLLSLALSIFPLSFSLSHGCLCSYCWTRRLARTEVSYVYYKEFHFSVGLETTAHEYVWEREREKRQKGEEERNMRKYSPRHRM